MKIVDLVKSLDKEMKYRVVGIRPGEKLHEIMCSSDDACKTLEFYDHFVISPSITFNTPLDYSRNLLGESGSFVKDGFEYNSASNPHFLSIDELKELNSLL